MVSIPNRDFDELQSTASAADAHDRGVSIPNRDFDELQFQPIVTAENALPEAFQSLIGILMNCNFPIAPAFS